MTPFSFFWMDGKWSVQKFVFRTVSKKEFSCHEWRLNFDIVLSGHEWFAVCLSFNNIFYFLVMDIHVGHHKVILFCFVYEEVFYRQAKKKKKEKKKGACKFRNVCKCWAGQWTMTLDITCLIGNRISVSSEKIIWFLASVDGF